MPRPSPSLALGALAFLTLTFGSMAAVLLTIAVGGAALAMRGPYSSGWAAAGLVAAALAGPIAGWWLLARGRVAWALGLGLLPMVILGSVVTLFALHWPG